MIICTLRTSAINVHGGYDVPLCVSEEDRDLVLRSQQVVDSYRAGKCSSHSGYCRYYTCVRLIEYDVEEFGSGGKEDELVGNCVRDKDNDKEKQQERLPGTSP